MRHPVPARLKAYARHHIDVAGEVEQHVAECDECALVVLQEMLDAAETPEEKTALDALVSDPEEVLRRARLRATEIDLSKRES